MRLTLRTLLAYLDDILDEQDAQQLKSKIDESEIATQLVQRIGQVGQTRLDAPHIDAQGIGADANSVAEYLDNTLPVEQVPEFEQACLDSDVHLSEVAACHQILTLVLGEPAEISPRLKRSIHSLGNPDAEEEPETDFERQPIPSVTKVREAESSEPDPVAAPAPAASAPQVTAHPDPISSRDADEHWTKAPDYLVKRRRSIWKPIGIAALIFICLAIAGLTATGPLDMSHPLARLVLGTETPEQPNDDGELEVPSTTVPPPGEAEPGQVEPGQVEPSQVEPSQVEPDDLDDNQPVDNQPVDNQPVDELPVDDPPSDRPVDDLPTDLLVDELPMDDLPPEGAATETTADVGEPADTDVVLPETFDTPDLPPDVPTPTANDVADANLPDPFPAGPTVSDPINPPEPRVLEQPASVRPNVDQPEGILPLLPTRDANDAADLADRVEPTDTLDGPREIGRFLSEDQVLTRFDSTSDSWGSLPPRASFMDDDLLLVFPIFRPQLMLATGMQVTLAGPARAQLLAQGPNEMPNVRLDFGRAAIVTFAQSGTMIGISWGEHSATVSLSDTGSSFAVEVDRVHGPGANIETEPAHTVVRVIATSGNIQWQMADAEPVSMTAGQQLLTVDGDGPQVVDGEIPEWIEGRDARPRDPLAIRGLKPFLTEDRSVSLSLREQADSKRQEVRSLAVTSLAYLAEFDPLLVALNDDRLKSYWSNQYQVLRHAASLDNGSATRVRQAIEARHGEDGQQLFRMLQGYSPNQLNEGGAQTLVDFLDHESSDFRVAAIENLKAITGVPSLYMPHYSEKARRKHIVTWRNKLNKGQIKYREAPVFSQPVDAPAEP